ncbi:MAG: flavodoxin family protein [Deltaproteobacteria bacterium]|jgi:flavodoxin|nr:flavodoxin family protein [Deltaproteobacteria bacterium]
MKILVVYSTQTGNTKTIAEGLASGLGEEAELFPVAEAPEPAGYDLVVPGFWVDKGRADKATLGYLERIRRQKTAFFFTLGAYPDSPRAEGVEKATREALEKGGNTVLGSFRCQGKVDPEARERTRRKLPPDHPHVRMTEERRALLAEAARHPDGEDVRRAAEFGAELRGKAG